MLRQIVYGLGIVIGAVSLPHALFGKSETSTSASPKGKTASEQYQNIQVLKATPADELLPAMQFISYSLGVECSFCHVEKAPEKDDKKPKANGAKDDADDGRDQPRQF